MAFIRVGNRLSHTTLGVALVVAAGCSDSEGTSSDTFTTATTATTTATSAGVHYMWARGLMDGCTDTTFCPTDPAPRDVAAGVIARSFELSVNGPQ